MKVAFRITRELLVEIHEDLSRPHEFAAERVGFLSCGVGNLENGGIILLAQAFHPVSDDHYVNDPRVGALMSSAAIRTALQLAYHQRVSMFHVHRHEHRGKPSFSQIDLRENKRFVPDFWKVRPGFPHGAVVLSHDSASGLCWIPATNIPLPINSFTVVGRPTLPLRETA